MLNDLAGAEKVAAEIWEAGGEAVAIAGDISRRPTAEAAVAAAVETFGGLDVVVANAGVMSRQRIQDLTEEELDRLIDVHLKGAVWLVQGALPLMRTKRYGRIILTTSGSGLFGQADAPGYAAAKAAVAGFGLALALDAAADGVLTNLIAPLAYTPMTVTASPEMADLIPPEQVSAVVCFLASEACTLNRTILDCGAGAVATLFAGVGKGWRAGGPLTPELVLEHLAEITYVGTAFRTPTSVSQDAEAMIGRGPIRRVRAAEPH